MAFEEDESKNNAHHGPPILTDRDLHILEAMVAWIEIVRKEKAYRTTEWLPSNVDMRKSRLFWRLRSGKKPLPSPPPCAYSCPWYEVIEEDRAHWAYDDVHILPFTLDDDKYVSIAQTRYKVEKMDREIPSIVSFGPYRFKLWKGENEVTAITANGPKKEMLTGYWIQIIKENNG